MSNMKRANKSLSFDYIVVGSGPAGAVIAKTLADNKRSSVLLLEAGENKDNDIPIRDSAFALELEEEFFPNYFWQGEGVPQQNLDGRSFEWTTGRLSGGGSSINGEQYVRPTAAVLREWERLNGPLWSPRRALQRFKRLETYNGKTNNRNAHGYHGKINIRQAPANPTRMADKLTSAIERATGFTRILDYNDPKTPMGPFTRWQLYQQPDGRRESSSTAFLRSGIAPSAMIGSGDRKLRIFYKTTVLRVLFHGKCAVGAEFLKEGRRVRAYAKKKVILSAGINSPQLLMLSGIGPAADLKKAGIRVISDNPNVGKRLRNHTLNFATFTTNPEDRPLPRSDPDALYTGGAFLPDPTPGENPARRGVQLVGLGSDDSLTLAIIYLRPKSRGSIRIQSKDPLQIVLANEGFLDDPRDLETIKLIYRTYILDIASELSAIDGAYRLISPTIETIHDDAKLEEFIKQTFEHNHHQQGFLRMAPFKKGGVTDSRGRVHGVANLIVADASLVPFTVDGNTSAAAYLIGYTIAKQIRAHKIRSPSPKKRLKKRVTEREQE